jgi:hypothetical protein
MSNNPSRFFSMPRSVMRLTSVPMIPSDSELTINDGSASHHAYAASM